MYEDVLGTSLSYADIQAIRVTRAAFVSQRYRRPAMPASLLRPGFDVKLSASSGEFRAHNLTRKQAMEACNRVAHENYVRESTRDVKNCGDWMDREKARKNEACLEFGI